MAAIQKIRSKGALLVIVIGLALFAFIAEELVRSISTTSAQSHNVAGKVYGKKLDAQEFYNLVNTRTEIEKLLNQGELTQQQQNEIREQVWQQFVSNALIEEEAGKLGLRVTDGEVQFALQEGHAQSLQQLATLFPSQNGRLDFSLLQQFLKDYDKNIAQLRQQGNSDWIQQYETLKAAYEDAVQQLRCELLAAKYQILVSVGMVSDPVCAKVHFAKGQTRKDATIAALPYSTVEDKEVKVEDKDIKAAYEQMKENFAVPYETVDLLALYVQVEPSAADREALTRQVAAAEQQLRDGVDAQTVVRSAASEVEFTEMPLKKETFARVAKDVADSLESVAVGHVHPTYYSAQDKTITTWKLLGTEQLPDSVQYRQIFAVAQDVQARKTQADSILNALKGGASFDELAKAYGQNSDSVWMTSAQYEMPGASDVLVDYMKQLNAIPTGETRVISNEQGAVVVQVIARKNYVTKYQVAVVKCPLHFSDQTYQTAYNKLTQFLSANQNIEKFQENAQKQGYQVQPIEGYTEMNGMQQSLIASLGGKAREAVMWAFNDADAGEVSSIYECGQQNEGLLVLALRQHNKAGYRAWNDPTLKDMLTDAAKLQKKAAIVQEKTKNVKSFAELAKMKGAITGDVHAQNLLGYTTMPGVNVPEMTLTGAVARTANGKESGLVVGSGAVYVAKVTAEKPADEKAFDATATEQQMIQLASRNMMNGVINYLRKEAEIVDRRYQF